MTESFDPEQILEVLTEEGADFLVIGGVAAGLYGSQRPTYDLDILPEPGIENARRLERALERLHARFRGIGPGEHDIALDAQSLAGGANFMLSTSSGDLDVMAIVDGGRPWDQLARRAVSVPLRVGERSYRLISRDDLIAMKRASGRRQDIEDIVQLTVGLHQARHARAAVSLTGRVRPEVREDDAVEAARLATLSYEQSMRVWVQQDEGAGVRHLRLDAELQGFTRAHAETWVSVVTAKIEASEVIDGEMEADIRASTD
jgi:hypothetical protein